MSSSDHLCLFVSFQLLCQHLTVCLIFRGGEVSKADLLSIGVPFSLGLSEKERAERDAVELPYQARIGDVG